MRRRFLALVVAGVMAVSLAACGGSDAGTTQAANETTAETVKEEAGAQETAVGEVAASAFKPSKDFNIRVPFAAGGSADTI